MTYYIKPYRCVTIVIVYSDHSLFDKISIGPVWSYCEKKNIVKKRGKQTGLLGLRCKVGGKQLEFKAFSKGTPSVNGYSYVGREIAGHDQ